MMGIILGPFSFCGRPSAITQLFKELENICEILVGSLGILSEKCLHYKTIISRLHLKNIAKHTVFNVCQW